MTRVLVFSVLWGLPTKFWFLAYCPTEFCGGDGDIAFRFETKNLTLTLRFFGFGLCHFFPFFEEYCRLV